MALKIGDPAPSFSLEDQSGETRRLDDVKGRILVLFFHPKDETPGCTAEACTADGALDLSVDNVLEACLNQLPALGRN